MCYQLSLTVFGRKCWEYTFTSADELSEYITKWYRDMQVDWYLTVKTVKWE